MLQGPGDHLRGRIGRLLPALRLPRHLRVRSGLLLTPRAARARGRQIRYGVDAVRRLRRRTQSSPAAARTERRCCGRWCASAPRTPRRRGRHSARSRRRGARRRCRCCGRPARAGRVGRTGSARVSGRRRAGGVGCGAGKRARSRGRGVVRGAVREAGGDREVLERAEWHRRVTRSSIRSSSPAAIDLRVKRPLQLGRGEASPRVDARALPNEPIEAFPLLRLQAA